MIVRELMAQPVVVVRENTTLEVIARTLLERRIGCVPVVNERGELIGIVTESDFAAKDVGFLSLRSQCTNISRCLATTCPVKGSSRSTAKLGR